MSWSQKLLSFTIATPANTGTSTPPPGTGAFTGPPPQASGGVAPGGSVNIAPGLRSSVRIFSAGAWVGCHAEIKIWGLTQALMNQLATLGLAFNILPKNTITVMAGDVFGMTTVFQGTIYAAYGDYEKQPDVPMVFIATSGGGAVVAPASTTTFPLGTSIPSAMQTIAGKMNFNFENNGVSGTIDDEYVEGTLYDQARTIAEHGRFSLGLIGTTLSIWPQGGSAASLTTVPQISPSTGMIGYPAFTQQGIIVKSVFNPNVVFGGQISVQSSLQAQGLSISGTYAVNKVDHALDSYVRNGQWMSTVFAYNPAFSRNVIPPVTG